MSTRVAMATIFCTGPTNICSHKGTEAAYHMTWLNYIRVEKCYKSHLDCNLAPLVKYILLSTDDVIGKRVQV